jgi:hypothetical protein
MRQEGVGGDCALYMNSLQKGVVSGYHSGDMVPSVRHDQRTQMTKMPTTRYEPAVTVDRPKM